MTERLELVVVGAGPAGMEAAIAAAEAGSPVTLIDGYPRPGGQYFKQLPTPLKSNDETARQKQAEFLFRRLEETGRVRLFNETIAWNAYPAEEEGEWVLSLYGPHAPDSLQTKTLIIASGTYDRPVPFPGWTLPGVMTAGAVQILLKTQRILPGRRFLLSGTGPLQLAVAAQLVYAGAEVVAVLEAAHIGLGQIRHIPALWRQWAKLGEGWEYWRTLQRAGVPLRYGHAAIEARGKDCVEEVVTARLDTHMNIVLGAEQTVPADTLIIGYGFLPSNELTRLLGCEHHYVAEQRYYVPTRDDKMQTSQPGVYAVGDGTGVGGAELSRLEGRIAGLAAAWRLGHLDTTATQAAIAREQPALVRERRFARMLTELFAVGSGLISLAKDETCVCRCEEVTKGEIVEAIEMGCHSLIWIKRMTRAGMGMCQGRICGQWIVELLSEQLGLDPSQMILDTVRPPIRPVPISSQKVPDNDKTS